MSPTNGFTAAKNSRNSRLERKPRGLMRTSGAMSQRLASLEHDGLIARTLDPADRRGVVVTRRSGREKLHFLNPVPIRLIHDRWIDKYTERQVSALANLKSELEETG